MEAVALAIGREAGQEEAREAPVGLRQDQERVAHRRRAEPLVPGDLVLRARPAAVQRPGDGGVGAHVGAALLLGHRHPAQRARLVRRGDEPLAVVGERQEAGLPLAGQLRLLANRGNHGVGHRDRAAHPGLDLRQEDELRRPGHVGARPRVAPRRRVQPLRDPQPQQLVPGRVELDLVDPVAEAVVSAQLRRVLVRLRAAADHVRAAADRAQLAGLVLGPVAALAAQRLDQHRVPLEDVVALQRRRLVGDLVGRLSLRALDGGHGDILASLGNRIRGASIASRR